jgi:hypothetical protein
MPSFRSTQRANVNAMVGNDPRYKFLYDLAAERAGLAQNARSEPPPKSEQGVQAVGDKSNLQGGKAYRNDTPSNWLRGMGAQQAQGKPNFDYQQAKQPQSRNPSGEGPGARRK